MSTRKHRKCLDPEIIRKLVAEQPYICKQEIAEKLNESYARVDHAVRRHGILVKRCRRNRKRAVYRDRARLETPSRLFMVLGYLLNNPNDTLQQIADQFHCTSQYVNHIEAMARQVGIIKPQRQLAA
jgi:predicted transcriptional regulator